MAAESRIPAMAPTTHAAPKLARVMARILRACSLSCNFGSVAGATKAPRLLVAGIFRRPFVSVLAVNARLSCDARFSSAFSHLIEIYAAFRPQRFLKRLASLHALLKRVSMNAADPAPFGQGVRLSVCTEISTNTPIVHLNAPRGPLAISGFVIAVVVDALKRQLRSGLAKVREEVLEALPALANLNAATAVVGKVRVIRVLAALPHPHPDRVRSRAGFPVRDPDHAPSISEYMNGATYAI